MALGSMCEEFVCFDIDLDDDVEVYEETLIDFNEFDNCEIEIPDDINISDLTCIEDEEEDIQNFSMPTIQFVDETSIGSVICSAVVEQVVPLVCVKCSKPYINLW